MSMSGNHIVPGPGLTRLAAALRAAHGSVTASSTGRCNRENLHSGQVALRLRLVRPGVPDYAQGPKSPGGALFCAESLVSSRRGLGKE